MPAVSSGLRLETVCYTTDIDHPKAAPGAGTPLTLILVSRKEIRANVTSYCHRTGTLGWNG